MTTAQVADRIEDVAHRIPEAELVPVPVAARGAADAGSPDAAGGAGGSTERRPAAEVEAVGERLRQMLRLAAEEAEDLRIAAREEAEAILRAAEARRAQVEQEIRRRDAGVVAAREEAALLLQAAQRDADELRRRAGAEADRLLAAARQNAEDQAAALIESATEEAQRVLRDAEEVRRQRSTDLEAHLTRLHAQVEELEARRLAVRRSLSALRASLPGDDD